MRRIFLALLFFYSQAAYSDAPEYQLLWDDLAHCAEIGYKAHFGGAKRAAEPTLPEHTQMDVVYTGESCHFAVIGRGFFKIVLPDGAIGYTRSGEFNLVLHETEDYKLTTKQGYSLADPLVLYWEIKRRFFRDAESDPFYEEVVDVIVGRNRNEANSAFSRHVMRGADGKAIPSKEILEGGLHGGEMAKQLKVYDVPYGRLRHYKDAVYTLDALDDGEIGENHESRVASGCLEMSDVAVLPVLMRMYCLASAGSEAMRNSAFKAELIKIGIQKYALSHERVDRAIIKLHRRFDEFMDRKGDAGMDARTKPPFDYEKALDLELTAYQNELYYYIKSMLPFIQYDY
ncbi:MAG: hypothetical protein LBL45_10965 [Treponema sp.]|jgi:flagellar basal body rod protein FlgG|nr:hypothetical protein [Treponema sp.]